MRAAKTAPAKTARRGRRPKRGRTAFVLARQFELDLEPEGTVERRIQWSKATCASYEEMAARETDPDLRARFERRAAQWNKHVLDLIEERKRTDAQMNLF